MKDFIAICVFVCAIIVVILIIIIVMQNKKVKKYRNAAKQEVIRAENAIKKANCDADIKVKSANERADQMLAEEKARSAEALRRRSEMIESRREVLSDLPDKELLINVILALDGYATRIERLEKHLGQYSQSQEDTKKKLIKTQEQIAELLSITNTTSIISQMDLHLKEIAAELKTLQEKLSGECDRLGMKVDGLSSSLLCKSPCDESDLSKLEEKLDSITSELWFIKLAAENAKEAAEQAQNAIETT